MPSATPSDVSVSEAIAAFGSVPLGGSGFGRARETALARLAAARAVLVVPSDAARRAEPALASSAPVLRAAFLAATSLAAVDAMREDAAIVGAVSALAGATGCDDAATAEAIAVGREIAARVRGAIAFDAPWDAEAVADGIGAAVAVARLMALDAQRVRHALGLAATQATGLGVAQAADAGALARGKAAFDAIEGGALARAGFTAAAQPLEGRRGLIALMAHGADLAELGGALGERWIS